MNFSNNFTKSRFRFKKQGVFTAKNAFTLIELMVVISVIAMAAGIVILVYRDATASARDMRRKSELSQLRQVFLSSCYMPDAGPGEHDLYDIIAELKFKYPQTVKQMGALPIDPKSGIADKSFYKYIVTDNGRNCAFMANMERESEPVTLGGMSAPDPLRGNGVYQANEKGWNGSTKYFQTAI